MKLAGIDVGGTKTKIVIYDYKRRLKKLYDEKIITKNTNLKHFLHIIKEKTNSVDAIAFSTPGFIEKNMLLNSPNNKMIKGMDFIEGVKRLGKPYLIENDANCFTYAESLKGAGKGLRKGVIVGWTFGTGIGGGIVLKDKEKVKILNSRVGEFGHQVVPFDKTKEFIAYSKKARSTYERLGLLDLESISSGKVREELGDNYAVFKKDIEQSIVFGFYNVERITGANLHIIGGGYGRYLGLDFFKRIELKVKRLFDFEIDFSIKMFKIDEYSNTLGAVLLLLKKLRKERLLK